MPTAKTHTVTLAGNIGLREASGLAAQLKTAIAAHPSVTVVTDAVTDIDIAGLQVLVAAHRTALAAGKALSMRAAKDGAMRRALTRAGFYDKSGAPLTNEAKSWAESASRSQGKTA